MGIRINKVMGWGIVFPQTQTNGILTTEAQNYYDLDSTNKAYKTFLENKYNFNMDDADQAIEAFGNTSLNMDTVLFPERQDLSHTFTFLDDAGHGNAAVILTPFGTPEWVRHDDSIDYAESELENSEYSTDTNIRYQTYNQYPYSGLYMNADTGEQYENKTASTLRTLRNGLIEIEKELARLKEQGKAPKTLTLDEFATSTKMEEILTQHDFTGNQDLLNRFVPYVPQEIRDVAEHLNIFTNPETVLQLRPMLAQFWR